MKNTRRTLQMPPIAEIKPLALQNYNNVLDCESFLYLQRLPAQLLTVHGLNVLYRVQHRMSFKLMSDVITFATAGIYHVSWKRQWLERHREKEETEIVVYIYKRCF